MSEHKRHRAIFQLSRDLDDVVGLIRILMNTIAGLEQRIEDLEIEAAQRHAANDAAQEEPA